MEQDIFDIIKIKSYLELTPVELLEVNEMVGNEDEYLNMQLVLNEVDAMHSTEIFEPKKETKESLDAIFAAESFPKASPVWYNGFLTMIYPRERKFHQRPLVQIAAILLLFVSILPLIMNSGLKNESKQLAFNDVESKESEFDNEKVNKDDVNLKKETTPLVEKNQIQVAQEFSDKSVQKQDFKDLNKEITQKSLGFASTPASAGTYDLIGVKKVEFGSSRASSDHPDGVFREKENNSASFSVPVSRQPEILDLLTATF